MKKIKSVLIVLTSFFYFLSAHGQSNEFYISEFIEIGSYRFSKGFETVDVTSIKKRKKIIKTIIHITSKNKNIEILFDKKKKKQYSIFDPSASKNHVYSYKKKSNRMLYLFKNDTLFLQKSPNLKKSWSFISDGKELFRYSFNKKNRKKGIEFTLFKKSENEDIMKTIAFYDYLVRDTKRQNLKRSFLMGFVMGFM